ncbi:hypothetical protein lerEdw1_007747 [Lerista edwardsae]|nr:hypothetical protein lerEdw1_007747 [Lerista edwardsae]
MRTELAGFSPDRAGRQFEASTVEVLMVQHQSSDEGVARRTAIAGSGEERWELEPDHPGAQEGDQNAGQQQQQQQPCQCQVHDMEAAESATPGSSSSPFCACCGSFPWRRGTPGVKKKNGCPGLGLFYTVLSAFLFSVASLLLKKIEDVHAVEISAIRCIFQMLFALPGLIYFK